MEIPQLKIGNITAKIPIIQGGMGVRVSLSSLASAVANEGGIGTISSIGLGDINCTLQEYEETSSWRYGAGDPQGYEHDNRPPGGQFYGSTRQCG